MFEELKRKLQAKIEKNAVKSTMSWTDNDGIVHSEEVIMKKSNVPLGDWQRIYPPVNEDGSWNIMNLVFGGWRNMVKLMIMFGIIAFVLLQFYENFNIITALRETCASINNINILP